MTTENEEKFETFVVGVSFENKEVLIMFQETQEEALESLFSKLESGAFQWFIEADTLRKVKLNTEKIIAYGVQNG